MDVQNKLRQGQLELNETLNCIYEKHLSYEESVQKLFTEEVSGRSLTRIVLRFYEASVSAESFQEWSMEGHGLPPYWNC